MYWIAAYEKVSGITSQMHKKPVSTCRVQGDALIIVYKKKKRFTLYSMLFQGTNRAVFTSSQPPDSLPVSSLKVLLQCENVVRVPLEPERIPKPTPPPPCWTGHLWAWAGSAAPLPACPRPRSGSAPSPCPSTRSVAAAPPPPHPRAARGSAASRRTPGRRCSAL